MKLRWCPQRADFLIECEFSAVKKENFMKEQNGGICNKRDRISVWQIAAGICIVLALILWIPTLITIWYTYPVQDDFFYALNAKECMEEGHSVLSMAFIKTVEHYQGFRGYYTASFLMFLFSGLIDCSVWGIRIFQFVNCLFFVSAIYLLVHMLTTKIAGLDWKWSSCFFLFITACMTCVHYFTENENVLWLTAQLVYLSVLSIMMIGGAVFICGLDRKSPALLAVASVCGFLASGGSLNVTALCCILYLLIALWGMMIGRKLYAAVGMGITLAGALLNAVCPANFSNHGEAFTLADVGSVVMESVNYVGERYRQLLDFPVFCAILVALMLILVHAQGKSTFKFPLPVIFTLVMSMMAAVVVFPVMLGYSSEVYGIMDRAIFISDFAIYWFLLMVLLYWRGWINRKFGKINIQGKIRVLTVAAAVIVLVIGVKKSVVPYIPVVKQIRDFRTGAYEAYSEWCISIYTQVRESEEEIVTVNVPAMEDTTCLINPKFYFGVYDPEEEYANKTIASFYGKKAVYVLPEETAE